MKIFVNPGHGGSDCGAVGNGLKERDVVLNIGRRVENYLRAVGFDVKLFQYDGLAEICADANAFGADLFVSIHCNAATGKAQGAETYHYYGSNDSRRLAVLIQRQIVNSIAVFNRGVKEESFAVLSGTNMPAVLVETAFIDNAADAKLLVEHEDDFARAIARGISDYFATDKALPDVIDTPKSVVPDKLSEHFAVSEFVCHCCGRGADKIDRRLIELLEQLRAKAGAPIHINCGYRCPKHNAEVGGVQNSQHVLGTAADITIPQIDFDAAQRLVIDTNFDGIGFYPPLEKGGAWFIHVDIRDGGNGSHILWWE